MLSLAVWQVTSSSQRVRRSLRCELDCSSAWVPFCSREFQSHRVWIKCQCGCVLRGGSVGGKVFVRPEPESYTHWTSTWKVVKGERCSARCSWDSKWNKMIEFWTSRCLIAECCIEFWNTEEQTKFKWHQSYTVIQWLRPTWKACATGRCWIPAIDVIHPVRQISLVEGTPRQNRK